MTGQRPTVMIVQRVIRQYRIPFFDALRTNLEDRQIDLSVVHNTPSLEQDRRKDVAELGWGRRTDAREIGILGKTLMWQTAPKDLWEADLVVVEQANRLLLNYLLLARRRLGGPKVALWGHGDSPYGDANPLGEMGKRWIAKQPDWWFAYTDGVADLVHGFGFPRQRITSVQNATDVRHLAALADAVTDVDVERARDELGINGKVVGLFIGALVEEKRLDYLIEAADAIRTTVPEFELIIAGGGKLEPWVEDQARQRPWLHYVGQRFGEDLARTMRMCSMLLVPAWVGLVITDGFAAGIPVFTTASSSHPPEIGYLRHGQNGLLIDDGGDPLRYAAAVIEAIEAPGRLALLQQGARADAERFGIEEMASRFAQGVEDAISAGSRGRARDSP